MIRNPFEAPTASGIVAAPAVVRPAASIRPFLVFEEFLVIEELVRLLRFTLAREAKFKPTTVRREGGSSRVDVEYRRSQAIFKLEEFYELFGVRLLAYLPFIFERLGEAPFEPTWIEAQITASNDGDFYRPHADSQHSTLRTRAITFVYYFYRPPKAFTGGALQIYDDAQRASTVAPALNRMVLFSSTRLHEILPVSCPSRRFADSRFALNGWIHR